LGYNNVSGPGARYVQFGSQDLAGCVSQGPR
jgi:hypothetical protein